jgi:hypothetical protein
MNFLQSLFKSSPAIECPICMEKIGNNNCCKTTCGHSFHTSCLVQCSGKCPLCREDLTKTTITKPNKKVVDILDEPISTDILKSQQYKHGFIDEEFIRVFLLFIEKNRFDCAYRMCQIYYFGTRLYFKMILIGYDEKDVNEFKPNWNIYSTMEKLCKNKIPPRLRDQIHINVMVLMEQTNDDAFIDLKLTKQELKEKYKFIIRYQDYEPDRPIA